MTSWLWHNRKIRKDDEEIFSFNDRIRLGDAIFDTMLVVNGSLIHPQLHIKRLHKNADIFGFEISDNILDIAEILLAKNNCINGKYSLNTLITRGAAQRGLAIPTHKNHSLIIKLSKAPVTFPPIHAYISKKIRRNEGSPLSQIKSCNYGDNILALKEVQNYGGNEAILLNNSGHVCCASSSNIFVIHQKTITTPPLKDGVLNGVLRELICTKYNINVQSISTDDLINADAIFLTNSIRGIQFIETLNGQEFSGTDLQIDKNFYLK